MKPMTLQLGERQVAVSVQRTADDHLVLVMADGRRVVAAVTRDGARTWVTIGGRTVIVADARRGPARQADDHHASLEAPMPGKVVKVLVEVGDVVAKGQVLLTVEAMKMEHALKSPRRARVVAVRAAAGDQVVPGTPLCELEDVAEAPPEAAPEARS